VHTYHGHELNGYFNPAGNAAVRTAERGLARFADRLIAISETQKRELAEIYRVGTADQFRVVPLGLELAGLFALNPAVVRPWPAVASAGPVFTYVGRLVPIKDLITLVDAFAVVQREVPSAALLVVGDGPLRPAIEQRASSRGIARSVVLAGWQRDLAAVYGSSDVVVLSSRNEGTPVALIEAMAAGRAVVATAVGGVPDVVDSGHSGLLVPPERPELLGAAMLRLARNRGERLRLGQAGRDAVRARFDSERLVANMDQLYRDVLSSIRGA
jgi:glycosyltransferase involved in cell wall biosynthesis